MKSMSHREYLTRLAWIEENWNDPDRSDYYLMQIAQEIRKVMSKKPKNIKLDHLKIKFGMKEDLQKKQADRSKQIWLQALNQLRKDS